MCNTDQDQEQNKLDVERKEKGKAGYMVEALCRGKALHKGWASRKLSA